MDPKQLREQVIEPVLRGLDMWSEAAARLMLMTAAHESHMGKYIVQKGAGPACGIYQIEPSTARDVLGRYLLMRPEIAAKVRPPLGAGDITNLALPQESGNLRRLLIGDLHFGTAVARIKYWMSPNPMPQHNDIQGLAEYYKKIYNTVAGKAAVETVIYDYERFVMNNS